MTSHHTKRYVFGRSFYDDHVARACRPGTVVKAGKTTVTVDFDVIDWLDFRSDAVYYSNPDTAADMAYGEGFGAAYGRARSAAAAVRRLDANAFTPEEQAAGTIEWERIQREQADADREAQARFAEQAQAAREERERQEREHPRFQAEYEGRQGSVIGVGRDKPFRVGAIIAVWIGSQNRWAHYEVISIGERDRGWTHDAVVRDDDEDRTVKTVKVEVC